MVSVDSVSLFLRIKEKYMQLPLMLYALKSDYSTEKFQSGHHHGLQGAQRRSAEKKLNHSYAGFTAHHPTKSRNWTTAAFSRFPISVF